MQLVELNKSTYQYGFIDIKSVVRGTYGIAMLFFVVLAPAVNINIPPAQAVRSFIA